MLLTLGLLFLFGMPQAAVADEERAPESNELAAGIYPGVQLVGVSFKAKVGVPIPDLNSAQLSVLGERLQRMVASGTIDNTEEAFFDAAFKAIAEDPERYLVATSQIRSTTEELGGFGTGFVVTPDGYIVTAAHVVAPDEDDLLRAFAESALETFVEQDAQEVQAYIGSGSDDLTPKQAEYLTKAMAGFYVNHMSLQSEVTKSVTLQVGTAVAGVAKVHESKPVEVIDVGESYPGKDVAILKMDGQTHLPTLPMGTNDDVHEGDTLYVAGYPMASTFMSGLSDSSTITPTVTEGPLTAKKSNTAGTPIFQTQAPASPGNSGGPVVNGQGDVIGILVAGATDQSGADVEGQQFVIPASVISEKLKQNNVTPETSDTTELYNEALTAYFKKYYKRALPLFQQVKNLYPGHPFVDEYITKSQSAIQAGEDETPISLLVWALIGGGVAFVLLLAIGILVLILRKRQKPGVPGPAGFAPMGPGQPPGVPGYGQQPQYGPPGYDQAYMQDPGYPGQAGPYPQGDVSPPEAPPQESYDPGFTPEDTPGYPGSPSPGGYPPAPPAPQPPPIPPAPQPPPVPPAPPAPQQPQPDPGTGPKADGWDSPDAPGPDSPPQ
jgi:S1-C subfamily serine protease